MDITVGGVLTNVLGNIGHELVKELYRFISDVRELDNNTQVLLQEVERFNLRVDQLDKMLQDGQAIPPKLLADWHEKLQKTQSFAHTAVTRRQACKDSCTLCFCLSNAWLPKEVKRSRMQIRDLIHDLDKDLQVYLLNKIAMNWTPPGQLLWPDPPSEIVGKGIRKVEADVMGFLHHSSSSTSAANVAAVCGSGGMGKSTLLAQIYNTLLQPQPEQAQESPLFGSVTRLTVTPNRSILSLQKEVARSNNIAVHDSMDEDTLQSILQNFYTHNSCLLILDDVNETLQPHKLGFIHGSSSNNNSKMLIATRHRDVARQMGTQQQHLFQMLPLSTQESWQLFKDQAFQRTNGVPSALEGIAMEVSAKCSGMPLSVRTMAATMRNNLVPRFWKDALRNNLEASSSAFDKVNQDERHVYRRLKLSYDFLHYYTAQHCFLYSACMFSHTDIVSVDLLIRMWIADGVLLTQNADGGHVAYDELRERAILYLKHLQERDLINVCLDDCVLPSDFGEYDYISNLFGNGPCLSEEKDLYIVTCGELYIRIHDHMRAMAVQLGRETYLYCAGSQIRQFPHTSSPRQTRICLRNSSISDLPSEFAGGASATQVRSLTLAKNPGLESIPEGFLAGFPNIKMLDFSYTSVISLPASIGQLRNLQFLVLRVCTKLKQLPEELCDVTALQMLDLTSCHGLQSLPRRLGELQSLRDLRLDDCNDLAIPRAISQLKSLNVLNVWRERPMDVKGRGAEECGMEDLLLGLTGLTQLHLRASLSYSIPDLSSWPAMTDLWLDCAGNILSPPMVYVGQEILAMTQLQQLKLQNFPVPRFGELSLRLEKLEKLVLIEFPRLERLPSLQGLPRLRVLVLWECSQVQQMVFTADEKLPELEELYLNNLAQLKVVRGDRESLPRLKVLWVRRCPNLRSLPAELPSLREFRAEQSWLKSFDSQIRPPYLNSAAVLCPWMSKLKHDNSRRSSVATGAAD